MLNRYIIIGGYYYPYYLVDGYYYPDYSSPYYSQDGDYYPYYGEQPTPGETAIPIDQGQTLTY